jgi:hypothetical protein
MLPLSVVPVVPAAFIHTPAHPVAAAAPSVQSILVARLDACVQAGGSTINPSYHQAYLTWREATAMSAPPAPAAYPATHTVSPASVPHPPGHVATDLALLVILLAMAATSKPKKPFTTFPKFDGKPESVPLFLERFLCYKCTTRLTASPRVLPTGPKRHSQR